MEELKLRVLENLLPDVFLGVAVLILFAFGALRLARYLQVSLLPVAALLPSFIAIGLVLYVPLSPLYVRSDGEYYQRWGYSLAAAWLSGEPMNSPQALWPGKGLLPLIIGGFTVVAGPVTVSLIVFNAVILALAVILLQKATYLTGGRTPRWSIVTVFLTSAPFLLWGPSLLREALFWLGVSLGTLALSYASARRFGAASLALSLSALVLLGIRPDAGVVLIYAFLGALIALFAFLGPKRTTQGLIVAGLLCASLGLTFSTALEFARGSEVTSQTIFRTSEGLAEEDVTSAFGSAAEKDRSSGNTETTCESGLALESTTIAAVCVAASNLPYVLFGPFYWEYGSSGIWWLAGVAGLHFLLLAGLATYFVVISGGRRLPMLAFLAVATVSVIMFASILTNYGIMIRFRAATEIILIPMAVSGALELAARWKGSRRNRQAPQTSTSV